MESSSSKRQKLEDSPKNDIHQSTEEVNSLKDSFVDRNVQLPEEILLKIIADLPLRDRKNTRLVCWRWYDMNNMRCISQQEKFICYGVYGLESVLQTIQKSEKKVLNLELVHFDFSVDRNRLLQFWMDSSARVESLVCTHCKFSKETVQDIIINCDKMQQFAIENPRAKFSPCEKGQTLISGPDLEKLIDIRRGNLQSFKLEAYNERWISNIFLRVMFDIYPNINDFSFICHNPTGTRLTFARKLKNLVDSKKKMKSINLRVARIDVYSNLFREDFPKLTSMKNIFLKPEPEHPIFGFLSRHNYLQFVEFRLEINYGCKEDRLFLEGLMNSLLDSCMELRSLRVEASDDVFLTDDRIFPKIKNSKLKSLYLNFLMKVAHCDEDTDNIVNKTLKCLHLYSPGVAFSLNHEMIPPFVRMFRGLTELMIDRAGITDDLLQDVFMYHGQLTSLHLNCFDYIKIRYPGLSSITNYGITGKVYSGQQIGYSIEELNKLESLALKWYYPAPGEFLGALTFSNVTTLYLEMKLPPELDGSEEFVRAFSGLPNLERLVFKGRMHYPSWLKICKQAKKLRFLHLESYFSLSHTRKFCDEHYIRLFENCPTLRVLHRSKIYFTDDDEDEVGSPIYYYKMYTYYLDIVTNRVKKANKPEERIFPPQMIGPCS